MITLKATKHLRQFCIVRADGDIYQNVSPAAFGGAPFEWASITKTLTAFIVYTLHAEGYLDIDEPIAAVGGPYWGAPAHITPRLLVEHRSGLPRMPKAMADGRDPYRGMTDDQFHKLLPALWGGVVGAPCAKPSYSNLGYAVLTDIVQERTKATWPELAAAHLARLGVTDEVYTSVPTGGVVRKTILGRTREPWSVEDGPFIGAGGLWGTLGALISYGQGVRAWTKSLPDGSKPAGWMAGGGYNWHTGSSRDSSAFLAFGENVVLATHAIGFGPFEAEKMARKVLRR